MSISDILGIKPGLTAVIGGGGKTALISALAEELKSSGTVIICTSVKISRPVTIPVFSGQDAVLAKKELQRSSVVCIGTDNEGGKLTAPSCSYEELTKLAQYVLVEADGAKGLPMKAHAPNEPVIPDIASAVILVMGAGGFGREILRVAHRPELFAKLANAGVNDILKPEHAARVAQAENLHDCVFINQVESEETLRAAQTVKTLLDCPVIAGSLFMSKMYF